ncbi:hypothetical protein IM538_21515 [Cytobacillus suaedae]|nr:hypothetical protein IM538_21515 [Cytobacillus suaedae]
MNPLKKVSIKIILALLFCVMCSLFLSYLALKGIYLTIRDGNWLVLIRILIINVPLAGAMVYGTWYCIDLYIIDEFRDVRRKKALAEEQEVENIKKQQKVVEFQEKVRSGNLKGRIHKQNKRR